MMVKHFPAKQKFVYICSVFRWWCRHVTSYQCDPELPILFLARLCAAIENVVASGTIKVDDIMKSECLDTKKRSLGNGMVTSKKVEIDAKLSGLHLNTEKSNFENCMTEEIGAQQEVLLEAFQDLSHVNRKDPVDRTCNVASSKEAIDKDTGVLNITQDTRKQINSEHPSEVIRLGKTCAGNSSENKDSATLNGTVTSDSLSTVTSNHIPENKFNVSPCMGIVIKDIKGEIEQLIWSAVKHAPTSHLMASVANKLKKLYEL